MKRLTVLRLVLVIAAWMSTPPSPAVAQTAQVLPSPLRLADVLRLASERRADDVERFTRELQRLALTLADVGLPDERRPRDAD